MFFISSIGIYSIKFLIIFIAPLSFGNDFKRLLQFTKKNLDSTFADFIFRFNKPEIVLDSSFSEEKLMPESNDDSLLTGVCTKY
ncbi:hypothetical protein BpHYR1_011945 [Brachionus plicatilis]|uniref:Uncharacterized protein n=1 Tax=Brachionus plicatilis TaxID=10195 RepID=A0A3M7T041_BRAPC|nr:hypothetical protein BpHYR1_011945 [Brachionus plicatilis]